MKNLGKKENIIKVICTLLLTAFIFCNSSTAFAHIAPDTTIQSNQTTSSSFIEVGNISILAENFSAGSMPPAGWIRDVTNPNGTWKIDTVRQHSVPNSASVYRGLSCFGLQDEWLITPTLNFSEYLITQPKYNKIFLRFWWYSDNYVVENSLIHFNVSISTNGGINWTKIWTAKDQGAFPQYEFTDKGMPIDLSQYRNETNVTIGFQFFSNTTVQAIAQFFAIDDILIVTDAPVDFTCDAGGPYAWYYYRQKDYMPWGVRFHGAVAEEYNPFLCQWLWDFGNNKTSQIPLYTWNFYEPGFYNVTLQVTYQDLVAFDNATVCVFLMPPPDLTVTLNTISFLGIQAKIENPGNYNATYVNWSMNVFLGPLKLREKLVAHDNIINNVQSHAIASIESKFFFGFGLLLIEIKASPDNIPGIDKSFTALKFGPVIIALKNL